VRSAGSAIYYAVDFDANTNEINDVSIIEINGKSAERRIGSSRTTFFGLCMLNTGRFRTLAVADLLSGEFASTNAAAPAGRWRLRDC
jgi:hypothetical protein